MEDVTIIISIPGMHAEFSTVLGHSGEQVQMDIPTVVCVLAFWYSLGSFSSDPRR